MARIKSKALLLSTFGILAGILIIADNQLKYHFEKKAQSLRIVDRLNLNNISEPPTTNQQALLLKRTSTLNNATTKTTHLLKNTSNSFAERTNTSNSIPDWVQIFHVPKIPFSKVKTPIVFYSYYRSTFFSKCLKSLALSANDIDESTPCIFVLYRTKVGTEKNVSDTLKAIERVNFCKKFVWQVNKNEPPAVLSASNYKRIWWKTTRMMFEREGNFSSILKDWNGEETLMLEEDLILSPDFIKAYWFASRIYKAVSSQDQFISGVAMGGWAGENIINTHPDTFAVRRSLYFQAMAYTVSDRLYGFLKANERIWVNDSIGDFTESIGAMHGRKSLPILMVVPTMARMWHIGAWGMGMSGRGGERGVEKKSSWADVTRGIDLENAVVNPGVRDVFGFLCKWKGLGSSCDNSWAKKSKMNMFGLMCVKQPYVLDPCLVPETKFDNM